MVQANNYPQCFDIKHWEEQGFKRSDVLVPLMRQAETFEISIAQGIYRKTANPDNPHYSLWWILIKSVYQARENAHIVVEQENYCDWPTWVDLRRKLWDFCNQGDKPWVRVEDCRSADDALWDNALERVCHNLICGSFSYPQECSEALRCYIESQP